jgi:hypothetical protein
VATTDSGLQQLLPKSKSKKVRNEEVKSFNPKVDAFFETSLLRLHESLDLIEDDPGQVTDDNSMAELTNSLREVKYEYGRIKRRFGESYRNVRDEILGLAYESQKVAQRHEDSPLSPAIRQYVAEIESLAEPQ